MYPRRLRRIVILLSLCQVGPKATSLSPSGTTFCLLDRIRKEWEVANELCTVFEPLWDVCGFLQLPDFPNLEWTLGPETPDKAPSPFSYPNILLLLWKALTIGIEYFSLHSLPNTLSILLQLLISKAPNVLNKTLLTQVQSVGHIK